MPQLYIDGPEVNAHTADHLGSIIAALQESGWSAESLVDEATKRMEGSIMMTDALDPQSTTTVADAITAYLGSDALKWVVWPSVTPADEDSEVGSDADALALAMYRGYIKWHEVADAIYWTAYVGLDLDDLRESAAELRGLRSKIRRP
jgi:lambda repressor-like predicted transcriptional regulator